MPALDPETRERWRDMVVVDRDAVTVGTIATFYLDQASGLPTWALVHTGWLGDRRTLVPLHHAVEVDGEIHLPYTKADVREAPEIDSGSELSADDELLLYGHYGLHDHHGAVAERPEGGDGPDPGPAAAGEPAPTAEEPSPVPPPVPTAGRPDPPVPPGDAGLVVTRSEEELRVGVRTRLRRLRLRKYVVTEYVTRTIPVRREKVRLEELPSEQVIDGGADGWPPGEAGASQLEVVLHREEPVVQLRTVPVERVRLVKRLVSEERTLVEELRKEQVEVDEHPPRP